MVQSPPDRTFGTENGEPVGLVEDSVIFINLFKTKCKLSDLLILIIINNKL